MKTANRGADFVRNMTKEPDDDAPPATSRRTAGRRKTRTKEQEPQTPTTRAGLKHIGAYCGAETVEKVAVLRARLNLDNSQLFKLAIDELYAKHRAKRAFGDA
jgi:hypothetical protein